MKSCNRFIVILTGILILVSAISVFSQDWVQWRGVNRDGKVSGFKAPQKWPNSLNRKWSVTVGSGDATPALAGDKLYAFTRVGENEVLLCLDAASGKELCRNECPAKAVSGPASRHPGPRSSPTVADGKVITLGVTGILSCLDASSGKVQWRNEEYAGTVPQFFTSMSPIVTDGMCIAHLGSSEGGAVIAFDLSSGAQKWRWAGDGPSYSSPVIMTVDGVKQLVIQTENNLVGVAVTDGTLLWQVSTPAERRHYNCATPIVDGQTVIYTGQGTGTRAIKIQKQGEGFTVKELWSNGEIGTLFNTPVLKDGLLFGLSDRSTFYCMNAQNGQEAWSDTTKYDRFGSVLDAGSVLLALTPQSELIAFQPDGEKYVELARIKIADTPTYAHPVISGNRVFTKDDQMLTLWLLQ